MVLALVLMLALMLRCDGLIQTFDAMKHLISILPPHEGTISVVDRSQCITAAQHLAPKRTLGFVIILIDTYNSPCAHVVSPDP